MVINGFSAILFNLVMLPTLAFLNFYLLEEVVWLAVPILLVLILAFVLMLPGIFLKSLMKLVLWFSLVSMKELSREQVLLGESFYE